MKRFKNILLVHAPGRRGRRARQRAGDLAARNNAKLTILEVAEPLPPENARYEGSDVCVDLESVIAREHEEALGSFVEELAGMGAKATPRVVFGSPFMSILREVHDGGHDLVLLPTEGDDGLKEHLFGSTSRHMLRKCPCPVWVVRPERKRKGFRVLVAINPAEEHDSGRNLVRTLMEMATSLARMHSGELDVVHVWQPAPRSGRVNRKVIDGWNSELELAAAERVAGVLREHDTADLKVRTHTPGGPTGLAVAEIADRKRSDVIVMGTLSRSSLSGMLMGNTTETVLQHIDASVLAVKPDGFESPITFDD